MKSLTPTLSLAAIAVSLPPAIVTAQTPYAKPSVRFTPFFKLDSTTQNIIEEKLGYNEVMWNNYMLAPIEQKRWSSLTDNERDGANTLGFTEDTWDCFINHYQDFTWSELEEKGLSEHYHGLGWTEANWEGTIYEDPYTEGRWWDQLMSNEKVAANGICYFKENWDRVDMNPNPSFFPHPLPIFRYKPWDELDAVTQQVAGGMLDYTEDTWNHLSTSVAEKNTFLNLDPDERAGAMDLGFYTDTWNCFMNHYRSYYWSSFHDDLRLAIETLGWDEAMWNDVSEVAPESEGKLWFKLTPDEKAAATQLCYFEETWDDHPIPVWYDYEAGKNKAVTVDGPLPKNINLGIFEDTGYVVKPPGSLGDVAYTGYDLRSSSHWTLASPSVLAFALSVGAFILV